MSDVWTFLDSGFPVAPPHTHLHYEDEVIHGLVPVEEVVLRRPLVLLVVLQLLDDVRVLQQAKQNLLGHLQRCERLDL